MKVFLVTGNLVARLLEWSFSAADAFPIEILRWLQPTKTLEGQYVACDAIVDKLHTLGLETGVPSKASLANNVVQWSLVLDSFRNHKIAKGRLVDLVIAPKKKRKCSPQDIILVSVLDAIVKKTGIYATGKGQDLCRTYQGLQLFFVGKQEIVRLWSLSVTVLVWCYAFPSIKERCGYRGRKSVELDCKAMIGKQKIAVCAKGWRKEQSGQTLRSSAWHHILPDG